MNKAELLDAMQTKRARWETLLAQVGEERMTQAGVEGEWSVKDIIAHVTAYERWVEVRLQSALRGQPAQLEADQMDLDQCNAWIFKENRNRPLHDVLAESQQVFQQLLATVQALSDEDLTDPRRLEPFLDPVWTGGLPLWKCIAADSYEHYHQHTPSIRGWLEKLNP
ncbi:MAG: ClbS/DfsB family four-helix bundle protein [Thiogranum sp.]